MVSCTVALSLFTTPASTRLSWQFCRLLRGVFDLLCTVCHSVSSMLPRKVSHRVSYFESRLCSKHLLQPHVLLQSLIPRIFSLDHPLLCVRRQALNPWSGTNVSKEHLDLQLVRCLLYKGCNQFPRSCLWQTLLLWSPLHQLQV
jgi:hypothetical protein